MVPCVATTSSCPHAFGYLRSATGALPEAPLLIPDWMQLAAREELAGIELPLSAAQCQPEALALLRDTAQQHGLKVIVDAGIADAEELRRLVHAATVVSGMDRPVVRVVLSPVLCGDRRTLTPGWPDHYEAVLGILRSVAPYARDLGVAIAVENHQDATSYDLVHLCEEAGADVVGVCLDTGNSLAVCEDPVEAARRVAPYVRHVHLKDYRMYFAADGFRLTRCVAGDGVVDFPRILQVLADVPHSLLPGIEVGAQASRHVTLLQDDWWMPYGARPLGDLLAVLRILWAHGLPSDRDWRTPWEKGAPSATVVRDEMRTFLKSVTYFRGLYATQALKQGASRS
ncbi:MAG: sugar phosphate isomerase/epimerase family protein [Chthonomonadales bacterium]